MIAIVARGACSALGDGDDVLGATCAGERASERVTRDDELARAGLAKPFVARARISAGASPADRATVLLARAIDACARELDDALPDWRSRRVGAAIGTSSGGMRAFDGAAPTLAGTYIGPLVEVAKPVDFEPVTLVLGACASSTLAIGIGRAWLLAGRCDVALCGGFDAVSVFVAAGFECLRATCGEGGPSPFREGRDGLALGEGAAIVALVRDAARARAWVNGFGATCDAKHLTAPRADGQELARAGRIAMAGASDGGGDVLTSIGLVSAHGTATAHNDAAEANAIRALGIDAPVHALKGTIGHTLGAAGALEVLAAVTALDRGIVPASVGAGPAEARVLDRAAPTSARSALKLSSAFGGANAALLLGLDPASHAARPREVFVSRAVAVTPADADPAALTEKTRYPIDRIARGDDLVRLTLAAAAALGATLDGESGIIVGLGLATIETNAKFHARLDRPEPRRFPYTTPNAAAGECAIAFGLRGPAFAVGGGPHGGIEALGVAADLVRTGAADRLLVVAVDEAGPATDRLGGGISGAVALVVSAAPARGRLLSASVHLSRAARPRVEGPLTAHTALLPLTLGEPPDALHVALPWGGSAEATFAWVPT